MKSQRLDAVLQQVEPPIRELVGSGVLLAGTKAVLYGVFKVGKSTLLQNIALSLAGGLPLFGDSKVFPVIRSRVLHVQLEIPRLAFKDRLKDSSLSQITAVNENFYTLTEPWLKLDDESGRATLEGEIIQVQPDVVVIDPIYKLISGSENSVQDLTKVFDTLDLMMEKHSFALIFSAQGRKTQIIPKIGKVDLGDEELRGSTAMAGWVDTIIGVRAAQGTRRNLSFTLRHGKKETLSVVVDYEKATGLYRMV